jgi:hypothetical protein
MERVGAGEVCQQVDGRIAIGERAAQETVHRAGRRYDPPLGLEYSVLWNATRGQSRQCGRVRVERPGQQQPRVPLEVDVCRGVQDRFQRRTHLPDWPDQVIATLSAT